MDISNISESSFEQEGSNIVERSVMRMLFSNSDAVFFAYFMVKMAMKEEKHPPHSMGMGMSQHDGLFQLSYDLERLTSKGLDDIDSVTWIDGHECWHWVLNHYFRELQYWDRSEDMMAKWHVAWNVAADLEIHEHYPPQGKLVGKVCQVGVKGSPYENFPKNATAEEYLKLIIDENIVPPFAGQGGSGQPGDPSDGDGDGGDPQPGDPGQGQSGSSAGSKPGRYTTTVKGSHVTIKDNQTGQVFEFEVNDNGVPKSNDQSPLDQEVLRQQMGEALKEARPSMGLEPGGLAELVTKLIAPPRIDWRHRFRQMVGKHVRFSFHGSWKRFSRRLGEGFRGRIKDHGLRIVVAVDTSGSVADYELAEFANEIDNMRMVHKVKQLCVIECDARVQAVTELPQGKRLTTNFHGRGGTDFRPVFEYIAAAKMKLDMLIFLTDSQGQWPETKPQYPIIWAVTKEEALAKIPWGDIVFLEVDEPRGVPKQS